MTHADRVEGRQTTRWQGRGTWTLVHWRTMWSGCMHRYAPPGQILCSPRSGAPAHLTPRTVQVKELLRQRAHARRADPVRLCPDPANTRIQHASTTSAARNHESLQREGEDEKNTHAVEQTGQRESRESERERMAQLVTRIVEDKQRQSASHATEVRP